MDNNRNFKGIWIPAEIWLSKELTIMEKLFLVEIDSLDNKEGCFANNSYFSDFFGLSKNRSSEIIKSLERKGFLTISYIYKEGSKQIEKRVIKVHCKHFRCSENRLTPSENRLTPSEKCEDNNTNNNTNNIINKSEVTNKEELDTILNKYNSIEGLPKCIKLTDKRKKGINARIKEYDIQTVLNVLDKVKESNFLKGNNNRGFKANIDWIFNPNNFIKILEDKYKNKKQDKPKDINLPNDFFNLLG